MRRATALLVAGLLLAAIPSTVFAADEVFTADLTGGAQVPPVDTEATGEATVTISDDESTVSWEVSYSGLSGDPAAGHIHIGPADGTGPVMIPFDSVTPTGTSGSFAAADYATGEGLPADWDGVLDAIRDGNTYVNVHTAANQAGEIRGQLTGSSTTPPPTDTLGVESGTGSTLPFSLALAVIAGLGALAIGLRGSARR